MKDGGTKDKKIIKINLILIVFICLIVLFLGSVNNILNFIISNSNMFFKIGMYMFVLGFIGLVILK